MTTTTTRPAAVRKPTLKELESSLEAHFNREVRLKCGGRSIKLAPTEKGVPDRMVLLPGGHIYLVELKAVDGHTSAAQDLWHARAAELGTRVIVLTGRAQVDRWITAQANRYTHLIK